MPAKSQSQERLFNWVHAVQKGEAKGPAKVKSMAKKIKPSSVEHYMGRGHIDKNLPEKVKKAFDRGFMKAAMNAGLTEKQAGSLHDSLANIGHDFPSNAAGAFSGIMTSPTLLGAVLGALASEKGRAIEGGLTGGAMGFGTGMGAGLGAGLGTIGGAGFGSLAGYGLSSMAGKDQDTAMGSGAIGAGVGGLAGMGAGAGLGGYGGYQLSKNLMKKVLGNKGLPWEKTRATTEEEVKQ